MKTGSQREEKKGKWGPQALALPSTCFENKYLPCWPQFPYLENGEPPQGFL